MKTSNRLLLALACSATAVYPVLGDDSHPFSISVPDFIIPLDGKTGTLDVYTDGTPPKVTGYNVLGNQSVFVRANTESSGKLLLNLHLPALLSTEAHANGATISDAGIQFTVTDLDLFADQFASGLVLQETASLTSVNGVRLASPLNFTSYLPSGTTETDEQTITLNPIGLSQGPMPALDFTQPFVLSFTFTATATARGLRGFTLNNAPDSIGANFQYTLSQVPEPSTITVLCLAAGGVASVSRRRRR